MHYLCCCYYCCHLNFLPLDCPFQTRQLVSPAGRPARSFQFPSNLFFQRFAGALGVNSSFSFWIHTLATAASGRSVLVHRSQTALITPVPVLLWELPRIACALLSGFRRSSLVSPGAPCARPVVTYSREHTGLLNSQGCPCTMPPLPCLPGCPEITRDTPSWLPRFALPIRR